MADWPLIGNTGVEARGITAVSTGISVTTGLANVKTATAVQLVAKTPFHACGIYIHFRTKGSAGDFLTDILAGAAGSEQVFIPNLYSGGATNTAGVAMYYFPLNIPEGTRLSVKSQSSSATTTITTVLHLVPSSFLFPAGLTRVEAVGVVTSTTRGTALTAPATADTYPAWVRLGMAPGGFTTRWVIPVLGQQAIATRTTGQRVVAQWGQGAVGSEQVFLDGWPMATMSSTSFNGAVGNGFPCEVKPRESLHGRYASSALTTLGADGILYCCG